jgi:hypothetical protein
MPVEDPTAVFGTDWTHLWQLHRELRSTDRLTWAALARPTKPTEDLKVLVVFSGTPRDITESWMQSFTQRLGRAAGKTVQVEPIPITTRRKWLARTDLHPLVGEDEEQQHTPGSLPPLDEPAFRQLQSTHASSLRRMSADADGALALLRP